MAKRLDVMEAKQQNFEQQYTANTCAVLKALQELRDEVKKK